MKILAVVILLLSVVNAQTFSLQCPTERHEEDLAGNGTPSQSSDYYWIDKGTYLTADLATSGTVADKFINVVCSVTLAFPIQYVAWWMLTFPVDTVYIGNVQIYYRENTPKRLAGYSLYVSNSSTSKTDGHLCYHHTGPRLTSIHQNVNCDHLGKHVIFYNERDQIPANNPPLFSTFAIVELCKVIINGCYKGLWDSTCSTPCPINCIRGHCYPGNGSCVWGCNSDNCQNDVCAATTGICTDGCRIGLHGNYCDKPCDSGKFGNECAHTCHCMSQPCNPKTGECPPGECMPGYTSINCSTECSHGNYGYNCNQSCDGCLSDTCDKEEGICTNTTGCKPGWQHDQPKCDLPCNAGDFGMKCAQRCYCRHETCINATGVCPTKGCQRGWQGDTCSDECSDGEHGFDCADHCNTCNSFVCERFEGNCTYGCIEGFTGHLCLSSETHTETSNIGALAGGIGGVVVAIVLVVILVIFIRQRSRTNKTKYRESRHSTHTGIDQHHFADKDIGSLKGNKQVDDAVGSTTATEDVNKLMSSEANTQDYMYTNHVSDEEGGNDDCVYSNHDDRYRIPVTELQNVINEKQRNDGFLKEYEILPTGLVRPHVEGSKEENKIKNRFLTTWPYDHSRVILQGNTSSDYINANYIDSYSTEKAYIASQGPKENTIQDFWQMVWQEKVDIIVMVTKLEEERRKKCVQYWPDSTSKPFITGQFKVSLRQEREHTGHVHRMIGLLNKESKSERTIHHFHFTQWPDHGVPDKIKLVSFYRKVKSTTTCLNGPMVVHCSAGVGRTGTFIAIDALYEHGQETGYIDIMEYVQMMRKDRMNMIQTKEQYATVFKALLEAFTVPDTAIDKDHFCNYLENQQLNITLKNQTFHKLEFQKLKDMKPTYSGVSYKAALSKENAAKNAVQNILPHDEYRPFLLSFEKSRNDYINAVIIPGYARTVKFLATQYPLQDTVVDFWSMVYDTDSTVVVMLEYVDKSVPLWPQKGDVFHFSKFNVSLNSDNTSFPLSLTLNHKETNRNRTVRILSMDEWNTENVPSSGTCMLNLLNNVSSWRKDHPGSVTVVCQDGCKRSGVFVALSLVLEKMEIDDEVDIFQVVRTIQIRRPEFFPNFNQYEYCYQCIKEHLEGNSLYANV